MISRLLSRLALNLLVLPYDLYLALSDRRAYARGLNKAIDAEMPGRLPIPSPINRVAIVAAYPGESALPFFLHLLKGLQANGFFILVVTTKKLEPPFAELILAHCHHVIERPSIGRDFGSYKIGWDWFRNHSGMKDVDTLAFVNDSMYYPAEIGATLGRLLEEDRDWLCLFENFESFYHTQAFFQIFRAKIFRSAAFADYWSAFRPCSSRLRIIIDGELRLTQCLLASGGDPFALYNPVRTRADVYDVLKDKNVPAEMQDVLNLTLGYEARMAGTGALARKEDFNFLLPADVASRAGAVFERFNPTHAAALLCSVLYHAPVKRDICYRGVYTMGDVVALVQGFTLEEKELIYSDLRKKGTPADFSGIRKLFRWLLWTTGRI